MAQRPERISEQVTTTVAVKNSDVDTRGYTVYLYLTPVNGTAADKITMGSASGAAAFISANTARKIIRAASEPSTRDDGSALQEGDGWVDTSSRDRQYSYLSGTWVLAQVEIPSNWSLAPVGKYICDVVADPDGTPIDLKTDVPVIIKDVASR